MAKIQISYFQLLLFFLMGACTPRANAELSPAAVGWGNLIVPGLGASLRGQPVRGLTEASVEIGSYYGGTLGVKEGEFTIDGSVLMPNSGNVYRPVIGQAFQEFGLKLHMYDTFYHYQQTALEEADTEREKNSPQPLYRGAWDDVLFAPFQWKNISSVWVYPLLIGTLGFELYSYHTQTVSPSGFSVSPIAEGVYGASQVLILPLGSSFGEEVLFRGFIQREVHIYTRSLPLAIAAQTSLYALIHPPAYRGFALAGGIYYGLATYFLEGDLEPSIASHFWVDVINGLTTFCLFRTLQGKYAPLAPSVSTQFQIPF